jgi:hypothetical protein
VTTKKQSKFSPPSGPRKTARQIARESANAASQLNSVVDQKLQAYGAVINRIFANEQELAKSTENLDEQFAVLTRLMVTKMNEVIAVVNTISGVNIQPISYESINEMFRLFASIKARSDFKEHARAWYTGSDVSNLPPPPVEEKESQSGKIDMLPIESVEPVDDGIPEGAQVFGGDYNKEKSYVSEVRHEVSTIASEQGQDAPVEVSSVPFRDSAGDRREISDVGTEVPQV